MKILLVSSITQIITEVPLETTLPPDGTTGPQPGTEPPNPTTEPSINTPTQPPPAGTTPQRSELNENL